MFDAWDNIFREDRSIGRCNYFHQHELEDWVSDIIKSHLPNDLQLGKAFAGLQFALMLHRRVVAR